MDAMRKAGGADAANATGSVEQRSRSLPIEQCLAVRGYARRRISKPMRTDKAYRLYGLVVLETPKQFGPQAILGSSS